LPIKSPTGFVVIEISVRVGLHGDRIELVNFEPCAFR